MRLRLIFLIAALVALVAACSSDDAKPPPPTPDGAEGWVEGTVRIGPLCPVEPCTSPIDPFAGRDIVFLKPGSPPITLPIQEDGTFFGLIPVGTYEVRVSNCDFLGCDPEPQQVTIIVAQTATLVFDIDTGIRGPGSQPSEPDLPEAVDRAARQARADRLGIERVDSTLVYAL
ncbi:MAG: hypothetical protein V3S98_02645, partial [Dehalococcoidia bacterium]